MSVEPDQGRWRRAAATVAANEWWSRTLPAARVPRHWCRSGTSAHRAGADLEALPRAVRPTDHRHDERRWFPLGADLVTIGRFDTEGPVRLRAWYGAERLSLRAQSRGLRGRRHDGVGQAALAHRVVAPHAPDLLPRVHEHRARGQRAWLVEDLVDGAPVPGRGPMGGLAGEIASRLHVVHRAVGIDSLALGAIMHPETAARWTDVVATMDVDHSLARRVHQLLALDRHVEVSFGHGDVVPSNILVTDQGVCLVDWEFAGTRPIAFELAKLHLLATDPAEVLAATWQATGATLGTAPDHYDFHEQVALAHVQMLTWHANRRRRAAHVGRADVVDRQVTMRLAAIADLLGP